MDTGRGSADQQGTAGRGCRTGFVRFRAAELALCPPPTHPAAIAESLQQPADHAAQLPRPADAAAIARPPQQSLDGLAPFSRATDAAALTRPPQQPVKRSTA